MKMVLDFKGYITRLLCLDSLSLPTSAFCGLQTLKSLTTPNKEEPSDIFAPFPVQLKKLVPMKTPATLETWMKLPTKADFDPVIGSWHLTTSYGEDDRVPDRQQRSLKFGCSGFRLSYDAFERVNQTSPNV